MKTLIADKFPSFALKQLEQLGLDITFKPTLSPSEIPQFIKDKEILIVRGTRVDTETLDVAKSLQLLVRAGAGINTIDIKRASELGIYVSNCPGKNAIAVAELAIGFLIALDRRIPLANNELLEGHWNKKEYSKSEGLFGKSLGVLGFGAISKAFIHRAKALGLNITVYSRSLDEFLAQKYKIECATSLIDLAKKSDIISVHLPMTSDTKNIISEDFFDVIKDNAILINTSRGGIVDEKALLKAIEEKSLRYATDVFDKEPSLPETSFKHLIANHPNTICTPHIGASTMQAQNAIAIETIKIIKMFITKGDVLNCKNICMKTQASKILKIRHFNKIGVLAEILNTIRNMDINVEELENIVFEGGETCCANIYLHTSSGEQILSKINKIQSVIDSKIFDI